MREIVNVCLCLLLILTISCSKENNESMSDNTNPFFSYNVGGLEDKSPLEQISILKGFGYAGISVRMEWPEHVEHLSEFVQLADNTADFKIYSAYFRYNFSDPQEDQIRWKEIVDLIQNKEIPFWLIFGAPEPGINDSIVEEILKEVLDYCTSRNVPVTLYPHSWTYFYSAEQALPMVKKINHPNLSLAVHTCHELKAGNGGRLDEVVDNVKDYLGYVTISGAAEKLDTTSRQTMNQTTLQPLEDGTYDFGPFLMALKKIQYKGPVGYVNFGFMKDPEDYLPKSLFEWKRLKRSYLSY